MLILAVARLGCYFSVGGNASSSFGLRNLSSIDGKMSSVPYACFMSPLVESPLLFGHWLEVCVASFTVVCFSLLPHSKPGLGCLLTGFNGLVEAHQHDQRPTSTRLQFSSEKTGLVAWNESHNQNDVDRGRGIATIFLKRMLLAKDEAVALQLEVTPGNMRARNYYRKLGFRKPKNIHLIRKT